MIKHCLRPIFICLLFVLVFTSFGAVSAQIDEVPAADAKQVGSQIGQPNQEVSRYIEDEAGLILTEHFDSIASDCKVIEDTLNVRVMIKTVRISDASESQDIVDSFFSEWIRGVDEKRGVLIFALLPEGATQGKIYLRVGIGLKYLITKDMGENILNQVIIPNNIENKDGAGFSEGVKALRKMLVDDLKRSDMPIPEKKSETFSLRSFLWASKGVIIAILIGAFLLYVVYFVERCPRCNSSLKVTTEVLKEPGEKTLGLQRKIYTCEKCGFTRRKKEPIYPSGKAGFFMRVSGARRNVKIE